MAQYTGETTGTQLAYNKNYTDTKAQCTDCQSDSSLSDLRRLAVHVLGRLDLEDSGRVYPADSIRSDPLVLPICSLSSIVGSRLTPALLQETRSQRACKWPN